MAAHFEIVRSKGPVWSYPWHARFVASNGQIVWVTETYSRRRTAEQAIAALVTAFGFIPGIRLDWNVEGVEKVFVYPPQDGDVEVVPDMPIVKYIDERKASR